MPVLALEAVAGSKLGSAFVILPDFIITGFSGLRTECALFEDRPLGVAIQFKKPGLPVAVPSIG